MSEQEASGETAQLLQSFLRAPSEPESQCLLGELLANHAEPISRRILRGKLRDFRQSQDAEDLGSEVRLKLLKQLSQLRDNGNQHPIRDFASYVAVVTYHTWDEYLRQKYPQRARLKNKLRYFLTHRRGFALWEGEHHQWLCSFAAVEKGTTRSSWRPGTIGIFICRTGLKWNLWIATGRRPAGLRINDVQSEGMSRVVVIGCRQILQSATARNRLRT